MANPIATVVNLNGAWASGGITGPLIAVSGNAVSVDMSAFKRPFAAGSVLDSSHISVTFGDDSTFTATLIPAQELSPDTIQWSNNSAWTKVPLLDTTVIDLNGTWLQPGTSGPIIKISVSGRLISVDMSAFHRPQARGVVIDFADIFVDFPDETGHTARLELPSTMRWSNNAVWQKVVFPKPMVTMVWETSGQIKTLVVLGTGFPEGQVTIKVSSGNFPIAHMSAFAGTDGKFTASQQGISCTGNSDLNVTVFDSSNPSTPVITTSTICPQPQP